MLSRRTRRLVVAAVAALCLLPAGSAAAVEDPWLPDPDNNEGPYIITGTGPPNVRVDIVRTGTIWSRPHYFDTTLNKGEGEYTSPSGQFRIDEGFCNPAADCHGGDDDPFQLVFYNGPSAPPLWGSGTPFRVDAQQLNLPEVEDVPREDRVSVPASAPGSLPGFTTISGTTRIVRSGTTEPAPLDGVLVDAFSPGGRGSDDLYYSGGEYAARTYSTADGTWSMRVPTGSWALRYRTGIDEPFYPGYIWNDCVIEPSYIPPPAGTPPPAGATFVAGSTTGVGLTVGEDETCNGSAGGGNPGGGNPGGGHPGGGNPGGGNPGGGGPGGGGPGGGGPVATLSPARATSGADGSVSLALTVSGPGTVTAAATVAAPKGGAKKSAAKKKVTVAKASIRAKKAGPVQLVLKLNKAGKKLLGKKSKLTAKAAIAFKPASGPAATTTKSVTFKKKKKPRPKGRAKR
jgi:hypothetical protein